MKQYIYQFYTHPFNGIMEIARHSSINYTWNYAFYRIEPIKWIDKILGANIEETSAMSIFKINHLQT